ncbi:oxidoreductase [Lactobacillus sp. CBA3606]|uniref:NADP-dependent oxidoreductase n=1 Tax=Lactobacillus sp. CBA3606 TaxID=2099789 RepID=UPI000CFAB329|nr:NADP-dependent oxidoreductase [Lactobacillus sp. CBA3606]AVK63772.1 oxidoreductase [Lactobacillus sp. CBA3606]
MQAAQLQRYQTQFKLQLVSQAVPQPATDEVVVQVKAAAVNPLDRLIGSGQLKVLYPYKLPVTLGNEISGVVTAVGSQVTTFAIGDQVYGRLPIKTLGGFAEYTAVAATALALIPAGLDFVTSVAIPLTGLTAYQALHEILQLSAGQTVLIPGGSGSFGQLAVPIAKQLGLHVIVTGNQRAKASILALGADQYLDYRTTNYWETLAPVDAVIDTLGKSAITHELAVLKRGGQLLSLKAGPNYQFARAQGLPKWQQGLLGLAGAKLDYQAARQAVHYRFMFVRSAGDQLQTLANLITQQQLRPAIDPHEFSLAEINEALTLVGSGHPKGKVVIRF